ncbi:hypothetical protein FB451DRAFT_1287327 [Mycena latifolia]|nr:hypothetical protein FB451DRAFT_1287327 [Mycena latifolia]
MADHQYPFYPQGYAGYGPSIPACNGSGCVHSRTCPASYHSHPQYFPAEYAAERPYLNVPFADGGDLYIDPVHGSPTLKGDTQKNTPCLFFLQNRCSQGDTCRFSHSVSNPSDIRSNISPSVRCKFFLQGSCKNGESCLYLHDTDVSSTSGDDHEPSLAPVQSETPLGSEGDAHETEGAAVSSHTDRTPIDQASPSEAPPPDSSSPVISAVAPVFEPCTFHITGRCVRGDLCVVRHYEPVGPIYSPIPSISPLIPDSQGDGDWMQFSEEAIARASSYDPPPCTFFAKGLCNMGDRCRFRHYGTDSQLPTTPQSRPQKLRPCKYFADGHCAKGLMCPFLHEIRAPDALDPTVDEGDIARPCGYYSQGKCRKGDKCRFLHDSNHPFGNNPIPIQSPSSGPFQPSEEQHTNWLLDTDNNAAWGPDEQSASKWTEEQPIDWHLDVDSTPAAEPSQPFEEQPTNWLLETDNNPAWGSDDQSASKWIAEDPPSVSLDDNSYSGETATDWFQDTENTEWATENAPVDENSGAGWLQETDENPAWNIDAQDASKWITDPPPRGTDWKGSIDAVKDPGAEQSWDLPWPDAVPDVKPPRKAYCKYFGQGHCYLGETCEFLHDREKSSPQCDRDLDTSPQQDSTDQSVPLPATLEPDLPPQSVYRCMVRFGSGAIPEEVITPFESQGVLLSNYPPGMAHDDLSRLAEPYGVVKNTTFRLLPTGMQAHIEFEESSQAAEAAANLNGSTLDQLVLRAHLDCVGSAEHKVKLVWDAPSVSGWAFYPNVRQAKDESVRLNGIMYGDRKITAEYRTPSQKHSIPVFLTGLPLRVNREDLHAFCVGSSSVSLNPPNYLHSPNDNILTCLTAIGPVNSFEVLPTDPSQLKVTAFATFLAAAAANATRCISIQPAFHSKYNCSDCPFALIRDDIDRLRDSCDSACTIRYYDQPPSVHIYGRRAQAVAPVKKSLEALLFGFELACWDPYFDTASGEEALKRINIDTSFHIRRDKRHQVLRIWGNRDKAEKQITRLLKQVQAKRHSLRLDQDSMAVVLNGGLRTLQDAFGATKILLDLRSQTLTVLGDIKTEVESQLKVLTSEYSRGTGNCCLCFSDAAPEHVELNCTHIYCSVCLNLLLRPVPGVNFATPRCIAEAGPEHPTSQCLAAIPTHVILPHLSEPERAQLFESALLSWVRSDSESDYRFCISGCSVLYRKGVAGAVFTCPECSLDLCASCAVPVHAGFTCAEYEAVSGSVELQG